MKAKMILLNGPAECGKGYAVTRVRQTIPNLVDARCKDKLYTCTMELFTVSSERFYELYDSRDWKETPVPDFEIPYERWIDLMEYLGKRDGDQELALLNTEFVRLSVREAMIYTSEFVIKPNFGDDYFGQARAKSLMIGGYYVDDSTGFDEELQPTIDLLGQENIMLIRIFGRGDYTGDSRGYISEGIIDNEVGIMNSSTEETFLQNISKVMIDFYRG